MNRAAQRTAEEAIIVIGLRHEIVRKMQDAKSAPWSMSAGATADFLSMGEAQPSCGDAAHPARAHESRRP